MAAEYSRFRRKTRRATRIRLAIMQVKVAAQPSQSYRSAATMLSLVARSVRRDSYTAR